MVLRKGLFMNCPFCGKEMLAGVIKSARQICFTSNKWKDVFRPDVEWRDEILLSSPNWTREAVEAYACVDCQKIVLDYIDKDTWK